MNASGHPCPICKNILQRGEPEWVLQCPFCCFLCSTLRPHIRAQPGHSAINESDRALALAPVRQVNFPRILDFLQKLGLPPGSRLLDVGCGHGWFLKAAAERGFVPHGIEPDPLISRLAQETGFPVWSGFFPGDLPPGIKFDVLVFNDVFEHLLDVHSALVACYEFLSPGGTLVINLPVCTGTFYRLASLLKGLGIKKPFDRMWQKEFPSPHISYFHSHQLNQLVAQHHFQVIGQVSLPSVQLTGLWRRLCYDRTSSQMMAALFFVGITLCLPVLRLLPSDIRVQVFRKAA